MQRTGLILEVEGGLYMRRRSQLRGELLSKVGLVSTFLIVAMLVVGGCNPRKSVATTSTSVSPQPPSEVITTSSTTTTLAPTLTLTPKPTPTPTETPIPIRPSIIVTSPADSGPGSLRQALLSANSGDTITFDPNVFFPRIPVTIALTSSLPELNKGYMTIDASNTGVIIDGEKIQDRSANGLLITSGNNIIKGLQIVRFPGNGIWLNGSKNNTITGNYIGTDSANRDLGNGGSGIVLGGQGGHIIGPGNIIAHNKSLGVSIGGNSNSNTITRNSIYDNAMAGIAAWVGGNNNIGAPFFDSYNFASGTGTITGQADPNSTIEIFSDGTDEGKTYEGQTRTDEQGLFTFNKASPFGSTHLTATATDANGNTSRFSSPLPVISGSAKLAVIQEGNTLPKTRLANTISNKLADNRIGNIADKVPNMESVAVKSYVGELTNLGLTRFKWTANEAEVTPNLDWKAPEFEIQKGTDEFATLLASNGIDSTYLLTFWDKANHPNGWPEGLYPRFKTEEEIQRYLEYVRFIVNHFKGRIHNYELWNQPDRKAPPQFIEVQDYINLVKRVIPVIRQEDPEAKIVIGSIPFTQRDYLFTILTSDLMPLADAISWYQMPADFNDDFYKQYPAFVQQIKEVAYAHGFRGEFRCDEIGWLSPDYGNNSPLYYTPYSNIVAAKYFARGIMMHLGWDVSLTVALPGFLMEQNTVIRNLGTLMAGAEVTSIPIDIATEATGIRHYAFSLPDGSRLIALWTDIKPTDIHLGVKATLTIPDTLMKNVTGIDILNSLKQPLLSNVEGNNLVIRDLLIKDYPIFLRLLP